MQSSVRANFTESLSQLSKHSEDVTKHSVEFDIRSTQQVKGMNKKKPINKFGGKTMNGFPILNNKVSVEQNLPKKYNIGSGFASDSDEYANAQ